MKAYETSSTIEASPATIWKVLVDVVDYPSWESGVERVEGRAAHGHKLTIFSNTNPDGYTIKVTELEPPYRMAWEASKALGLFKGIRSFSLDRTGNGNTRFVLREDYQGPLRRIVARSLPDLQPSFDQFAQGLKQRAEDLHRRRQEELRRRRAA